MTQVLRSPPNLPPVIFALLLLSCASDGTGTFPTDCATSEVLGNWYQSSNNETITFTTGCRFSTSACAASGTLQSFDNTNRTLGLASIVSAYSGNPACALSSTRNCSYALSGSTLTLTCAPEGSGTYVGL